MDPEEAAIEGSLHESMTPLRGQASRRIANGWQRLGYYPKFRPRRGHKGAMQMTDLEQAAWDASVMHVSTGADTDGNSMTVVTVPGDNSDGPTSTGEGAEGTTRIRTADSNGGATSKQESSSSRLISVGGRRTGG